MLVIKLTLGRDEEKILLLVVECNLQNLLTVAIFFIFSGFPQLKTSYGSGNIPGIFKLYFMIAN